MAIKAIAGKVGWALSFLLLLALMAGCTRGGSDLDGRTAESATPMPVVEAQVVVTATRKPTVTPVPSSTPAETSTPLPPPATVAAPASPTPRPTEGPSATPTVTQTPAPTPPPITINGMPAAQFVRMSPEVIAHSREIFAHGQELGRDPHWFSKLGDSLVVTSHYLVKFDTGLYNLGPDYAFLQPVIDFYSGSFARYGVATRVGLHAWSVFDPLWADKEWCEPNETLLACEFRLNNPSILLIRLGSNDAGPEGSFEFAMRKVVEETIAAGIIPVLGTKADRFEGEDNRNNLAIRRLAEEYQVPLWDFDAIADTLPYRGVSEDDVHLTIMYEHDYTQPEAFQRGYPVNDLTALVLLHMLLQEVVQVDGVAADS